VKHAGPAALDRLEPLLGQLRKHAKLKEKSRGCFYRKGLGFVHFHEHGEGELYADVKTGADFKRLPANTAAQRKVVRDAVAKALAATKP
jgi:hypothetical protein